MRWSAWLLVAAATTASSAALADDRAKPWPVHVSVDADENGVQLVRVAESQRAGRVEVRTTPVCASPCEADVDARGTYRVTGAGTTPSATFALRPLGPTVALHVRAGHRAAHVASAWTLWGALGVALGGATVLALSQVSIDIGPAVCLSASCGSSSNGGMIAAGLGMVGAAAVAALVGLFLGDAGATHVTADRGWVVHF